MITKSAQFLEYWCKIEKEESFKCYERRKPTKRGVTATNRRNNPKAVRKLPWESQIDFMIPNKIK